jgi:hypothetical protein
MSNPAVPASAPTTRMALRWNIALLLLACLITAALVAGMRHMRQQSEQEDRQAVAQAAEIRNRLARVNDEERVLRATIARYHALVGQGRTQPEPRLEWVETLRHIESSRRLLGLDYELFPQRLLDEKAPGSGGFDFLASPMKLTMPLLHEDDLLGLLADLSQQVSALISVNHCRIERVAVDPALRNAAQLKAACTIDWITLQARR